MQCQVLLLCLPPPPTTPLYLYFMILSITECNYMNHSYNLSIQGRNMLLISLLPHPDRDKIHINTLHSSYHFHLHLMSLSHVSHFFSPFTSIFHQPTCLKWLSTVLLKPHSPLSCLLPYLRFHPFFSLTQYIPHNAVFPFSVHSPACAAVVNFTYFFMWFWSSFLSNLHQPKMYNSAPTTPDRNTHTAFAHVHH